MTRQFIHPDLKNNGEWITPHRPSVCHMGPVLFTSMITLGALFQGKTTMWEGVPETVSVIVFFILLEGMQIAFFAVAKLTLPRKNEEVPHSL
jgi:hypothetical protein